MAKERREYLEDLYIQNYGTHNPFPSSSSSSSENEKIKIIKDFGKSIQTKYQTIKQEFVSNYQDPEEDSDQPAVSGGLKRSQSAMRIRSIS